MAVTIKDVARETDLAISTISKYINGGKVKEENRTKIEAAIQKLGYQPNEFARGLRSAKTYSIGIIVDNLRAVFSAEIVGLIEKKLKEMGYSILLCSHGNSPELLSELIEFLVEKQVEGIVLEPITCCMDSLELAAERGIPVISIDRVLDAKRFDSVTSNSMLGIYQGVEYLIEKGHRSIAIITATKKGEVEISSGAERLRGYLRALEDYEIPVQDDLILSGDFSFQSGYDCMKKLWKRKEKPTAVIVSNYNMCLGMMAAIHEMKIKVAAKLSVVTFDDMEFSEITKPRLTAIRQPVEPIAQHVVEIMMKRIAGDYSDFPQNVKVHTTFSERESVQVNYATT